MLLSELLAPESPQLPELVRPADVGGNAAWQSLVRAGALSVLDLDAATTVNAEVTPHLRAAALAPHVPMHAYVVGPSAAWVHCGGEPPERLHLAHQTGTHRPRRWSGTEIWSGPGLWAHSYLMGIAEERARVTTPARTAVDLAWREPPEEAIRLINALINEGLDVSAAARLLEFRGRVRPQARDVFAKLLASAA